MKSRSFYRPGIIIPCLIAVILILTAAIPSRAGNDVTRTTQGVLQQQGKGKGSDKTDKITLCHATGNATTSYVEITVSYNAATEGHGHDGHADDIIPAPAEGCPTVLWPGGIAPAQVQSIVAAPSTLVPAQGQSDGQSGDKTDKITLCHATGSASNPYVLITVSANAATEGHGHDGHADDIIPAPAEGCPTVLWPAGVAPGQVQPTVAAPPALTPVVVAGPVCVDWLVYSTDSTGDWEIFRLGALSDNPNADPNLTKGIGPNISDIAPSISPDRRWITFSSNRDGNWEIYIASTDGTLQQRLTHTTAQNSGPVWSPTGQFIAFESNRDGHWELYMLDVTSGVETRLTYGTANHINAFWSPDGTQLLFQSDRNGGIWQIYELNIASQNFWLVSDGHGDDLDPSYSFDGTRILFRSLRDHNSTIYMLNRDGTNLAAVSNPAGRTLNAVWSPDDTLIAYQSNLDGDMDIYVYEVATGQTRKLTDNPVDDYAPTWLCASPTLAFTSDVDGNPNLFSAPALPILAAPLVVEAQALRMTTDSAIDRDPVNTPNSSDANLPDTQSQLIPDR